MDRLSRDRLVPPRQAAPAASQATESAILTAMALNPPDRPQSVHEFLQMFGGPAQVYSAPAFAPTALANAGAVASPRPFRPSPPVVGPASVVGPVSAPIAMYEYATFGRRFLASLVDDTILSVVLLGVGGLLAAVFSSSDAALVVSYLVGIVLYFWYHTYFYVRSGQTPGKKAVGIQVIAVDGSLLTNGRAFGRAAIYFVESLMIYGVIGIFGFLWMIWDKDSQTWHDKVANSYVIRV